MGHNRKIVLFNLLLTIVQRATAQGVIGRELPCEAPDRDPDPNNPEDNLSCPFGDTSCFPMTQLCDGISTCLGSIDEGVNIAPLDCSKFSTVHACCARSIINPRRACAARVDSVCLLSHISPLEHLFVLKTL